MRYRPIRISAQLTPSAIRFRWRLPDADLAPYVTDFWQYDVLPPYARVPIQVFPSGCVVLRFNIAAQWVEPIIYGPSLRPDMKGVFVRDVSAFGVALRLAHARAVVGSDIAELCGRRLSLTLFWPRSLAALCERLLHAGSFAGRVAVLANFLRRTVREARAPHPDCLNAIEQLSAGTDTSTLFTGLGVSERTLRRHFDHHVGLSPKQLARVIRVQTTLRQLAHHPDSRRARIALEAGFADQPHWNREFKRLLGMSPGEFSCYLGRFHEDSLPIWSTLNRSFESRARNNVPA